MAGAQPCKKLKHRLNPLKKKRKPCRMNIFRQGYCYARRQL